LYACGVKEKNVLPAMNQTLVVEPTASHYTGKAIPAQQLINMDEKNIFTVNKCDIQFLTFTWGDVQSPFQAILGYKYLQRILKYIQYIALLFLHLALEEELKEN
jgi:hypothetical protein